MTFLTPFMAWETVVRPQSALLRQLPPHPHFASLPEPIQPIGQVDFNERFSIPTVDGAEDSKTATSISSRARTPPLPDGTDLPNQAASDSTAAVQDSEKVLQVTSTYLRDHGNPRLHNFVETTLDQAKGIVAGLIHRHSIADDMASSDSSGWRKTGIKAHGPNNVEMFKKRILRDPNHGFSDGDLSDTSRDKAAYPPEIWFARRSFHANNLAAGNATFEEFKQGLKTRHAENERAYTPDVVDAWKVLQWDIPERACVAGYHDIELNVYEMCHKLPKPLQKRIFPVAIISACMTETSFIVVQVPITPREVGMLRGAKHCREGGNEVFGVYTSVEHVSINQDDNIQWVMATSSDAGGLLPRFVQDMGAPKMIARDVPYFLDWTSSRRKHAEAAMEPSRGMSTTLHKSRTKKGRKFNTWSKVRLGRGNRGQIVEHHNRGISI
ncbi:MAG: hypothetical protein M1817_001856 [Caeruleum heppii]|nr:MAG: hypothetical protein M1817_001856 [Caeruleum heppii]